MPRPRTRKKLTYEQFTIHAIKTLRKNSPGIHTVFDGFNAAFRIYFEGEDPIKAVDELQEGKKIVRVFRKGGARIYLPAELPSTIQLDSKGNVLNPGMTVLQRMGLVTKTGKSRLNLDEEMFTVKAIKALRDPNQSPGIHTVYTGFNAAFRIYFNGKDPVQAVENLHQHKKVARIIWRGGARIFLPNEVPDRLKGQIQAYGQVVGNQGMSTLRRMGLSEHRDP